MFATSDSDHPIDRIRSGLMIAIGGETPDDILTLIGQQKQVVERELAQVPARAESRGAEFQAKAKGPMDNVLAALREYEAWLNAAKESLEVGDTSRMVTAYEESHDILPALSSAVEAYGAAYAAYGPYQTVPVNGMARLADGIDSGEVQPPAWGEMADYYGKALQQKSDSIKTIGLPGKSFLIERYSEGSKEMARLATFDAKARDGYKSLLDGMDAKLHEAEKVERMMSESTEAPTALPATNVLVALVAGYQAGTITRKAIDGAVDDYGEIMDNFSETFEESVSKPIDSVLVQEEIPRTLDTLDAHYAAVEELIASLEGTPGPALDAAVAALISTANTIDNSRNVYSTALQHENQILCPSCGRTNPPENRLCEACGESLPRSADASGLASSTFSVMASQQVLEENKQMVMTENVARLFDACDNVATGAITHDEFLAEIRRASAGIKDLATDLDEVAEVLMDKNAFTPEQWEVWETQHLPHLEDVAQGFIHGMSEVNEGLAKMALYVEDPNDQHLVKGVRQVWEGLGVVHRSSLAMQTYSKMLDDIMGEAAADGLITTEG